MPRLLPGSVGPARPVRTVIASTATAPDRKAETTHDHSRLVGGLEERSVVAALRDPGSGPEARYATSANERMIVAAQPYRYIQKGTGSVYGARKTWAINVIAFVDEPGWRPPPGELCRDP